MLVCFPIHWHRSLICKKFKIYQCGPLYEAVLETSNRLFGSSVYLYVKYSFLAKVKEGINGQVVIRVSERCTLNLVIIVCYVRIISIYRVKSKKKPEFKMQFFSPGGVGEMDNQRRTRGCSCTKRNPRSLSEIITFAYLTLKEEASYFNNYIMVHV